MYGNVELLYQGQYEACPLLILNMSANRSGLLKGIFDMRGAGVLNFYMKGVPKP